MQGVIVVVERTNHHKEQNCVFCTETRS